MKLSREISIISGLAFALGLGLGINDRTAQAGPSSAAVAEQGPMSSAFLEQRDRTVDEAALSAERAAIARLAQLAKQRKGTRQEPIFLLRLAEIQHQAAAVEFRIGQGRLDPRVKAKHLAAYRELLGSSITPLTTIITQYPKDSGVPRAYFLRAKAYGETQQAALAVADFKYLINNYPMNQDLATAAFYLYDLLVGTKDYAVAIQYLKKLNPKPTDPAYTLTMDHLAWAHYYLNDLTTAMKYLELQVNYYLRKRSFNPALLAEWERALLNAALFYSTGVANHNPDFKVEGALNAFLRLRPGRDLSKVLVHFAYLLRARGLDDELEAFKTGLLASRVRDSEAIDVLTTILERELDRNRLDLIQATTTSLGDWMQRYPKTPKNEKRWLAVQKSLTDAASRLQDQLAMKKGTVEEAPLVAPLISLYSILLKSAETDRPRLVRMHYNLAEIQFQVKHYEDATMNYRWVVEHGVADGKSKKPAPKPTPVAAKGKQPTATQQAAMRSEAELIEDSRLKAIASRYEALQLKKLFPTQLTAQSMDKAAPAALPPEATSWVGWVNDNFKRSHDPQAEVFVFEANRMLYAQGHIQEALTGLEAFIKAKPKSKYAIPAAALILDTYLASERWEAAYNLATEYRKVPEWKDTEFYNRLAETAGDTSVKITEDLYKKGNYKEALARAQSFLDAYPTSKHRDACLLLAANSCLALNDKKKALTYFAPLTAKKDAKPQVLASAYLTSVAVGEEAYDMKSATQEMRKYLALAEANKLVKNDEIEKLRSKTLMLSILSGDRNELKTSLDSKQVCPRERDVVCERFRAIDLLQSQRRAKSVSATKDALASISRVDSSNQLFYAVVALEDDQFLSFEEHLRMFDLVSSDLGDTDWILKYTVLTPLSASLPQAVQRCRRQLKGIAKLKIKKDAIAKRVKLMEDLETHATKLFALPSVLVRVSVLNELANMYDDFASELKSIPAPEGLPDDALKQYRASIVETAAPFEKKRADLRQKAYQLASDTSAGDEIFTAVSTAYFRENPDKVELKAPWLGNPLPPLDATLLRKVEDNEDWLKPGTFKYNLVKAIHDKDWPRAAFFMQEAQDHKMVSDDVYAVVKAVALSVAGAQAEALVKLDEASQTLPGYGKVAVLTEMAPRFYRSYAKDKTKKYLETLMAMTSAKDLGDGDIALHIAHAAEWTQADMRSGDREYFQHLVNPRGPASRAAPALRVQPKARHETNGNDLEDATQ